MPGGTGDLPACVLGAADEGPGWKEASDASLPMRVAALEQEAIEEALAAPAPCKILANIRY